MDLLHFERGQQFMRNGEWQLNQKLGTACVIDADLRTSPELLHWNAIESSDAERFIWSLQAFARSKNLRAAMALWKHQERQNNGLTQGVEARRCYLKQMLASISLFRASDQKALIAPLVQQTHQLFNEAVLEDSTVLISFANLAADMLEEDLGMFEKLIAMPSVRERAAVKEALAEACLHKAFHVALADENRIRLLALLKDWHGHDSNSYMLLRCYQRSMAADQPSWKALTDKLLEHKQAGADDFHWSSFTAWTQDALKADALRWMGAAEKRFSTDRWILQQAGWFYFFRCDDSTASKRAFEKYLGTFAAEEQPVLVPMDLAIMEWITGRQEDAVSTFRWIFENRSQADKEDDWTDPETVKKKNWGPWQSELYESLRTATLAKHPELRTKRDGVN